MQEAVDLESSNADMMNNSGKILARRVEGMGRWTLALAWQDISHAHRLE